jgi:dolichyl-phosphate beta-glucosyltransferase
LLAARGSDKVPAVRRTVVIPAYNEERRLAPSLPRVLDWAGPDGEVIVVDDGSADGTSDVARRAGVQVLRVAENRGKGHALRVGIAAARGDVVVVTDADLASPIEEADRLVAALDGGAEIAIGVRRRVGRNQPWHRLVLGRVYGGFVRGVLAMDVRDPQCGLKAFRRHTAQALSRRCHLDSYSFDAEILALATREGVPVAQVPVQWTDVPGTKVRVLRDGARMVLDVLGLGVRQRTTARAPVAGLPARE